MGKIKKSFILMFKSNMLILFSLALIFSPLNLIKVNDVFAEKNQIKEIKSVEDLNNIKSQLDGHFKLGENLDLSAVENWQQIGSSEAPFTGEFDGNGFKIYVSEGSGLKSIFAGSSQEAIIKNLVIETIEVVVEVNNEETSETEIIEAEVQEETEANSSAEEAVVEGEEAVEIEEAEANELEAREESSAEETEEVEEQEIEEAEEELLLTPQIQLLNESDFAGGAGTEADPYLIATPEQLNQVRNHHTAHYKLQNDLDLSAYSSGEGWQPIGNATAPFMGTFDGNNKTIFNLKINRGAENHMGLFGITSSAKIKALTLDNVNVTGNSYVGGLIGNVVYNTQIENVTVTGFVTGNEENIGGLVGYLIGTIKNGETAGEINGKHYVGGLAGRAASDALIDNSHSATTVTGSGDYVGGLIGLLGSSSEIKNSFSSGGTITGNNFVGGLVGSSQPASKILHSLVHKVVKGNSYVGGMVGYNVGKITAGKATITVIGNNYIGGLAGRSEKDISRSNAYGSVQGGHYAGGLVGFLDGEITQSYATVEVKGSDAGGLVGYQGGTGKVSESYAAGEVTSTGGRVGGLIGHLSPSSTGNSSFSPLNNGNAPVQNSFYDKEVSGQSDDDGRGVPLTTAEMKTPAMFVDWDSQSVWHLEAGQYPVFIGEGSGEPTPITVDIISVIQPEKLIIAQETALNNIPLPTEVEVALENQTSINLAVNWDMNSGGFDRFTVGTYTISGEIVLEQGITNTQAIQAKIVIEVQPTILFLEKPYRVVPIGTSLEEATKNLPQTLAALLTNGEEVAIDVEWNLESTPSFDPDTAGNYIFEGVFIPKEGIFISSGSIPRYGVIVEEDHVPDMEPIIEITNPADITVLQGTPLSDVPLPTTVEVTLSDQHKMDVEVNWHVFDSYYDKDTAETYPITGDLILPPHLINIDDLVPVVNVIVEGAPVEEVTIINVAIAGSVVDLGTPLQEAISTLIPTINVGLSDGTSMNMEVAWEDVSIPVYDADTPGVYTFSGTLVLPEGITNPNLIVPNQEVSVLEGEDPGGENPGGADPGGEDPDGEDPGGADPGGADPGGEDPDGEDPGGADPSDEDPGGEDPGGEDPGGADPGGEDPGGEDPGGADPGGADPGGEDPGGADPGGEDPGGADPGGEDPGGADPGGEDRDGADPDGENPDGADPGGADPGGEDPKDETLKKTEGKSDEKKSLETVKTTEKSGEKLPKTSTNYHTYMLIGTLLSLVGAGLYLIARRQRIG